MEATKEKSYNLAFLPTGSFSRYAELEWDQEAYGDVQLEGRRRKIIRHLSRNLDSPIKIPHNFQIGSLKSSSGNGPDLHSHDYPEIFIPVYSKYEVSYGARGRNNTLLNTYDVFSVPPGIERRFEAIEADPSESEMIALFDTDMDDAKEGIRVTPEVAAATGDALPKEFIVEENTLDISQEEAEAKYIARYVDLPVEEAQGLLIRRVIAFNDSRAGIQTRHRIAVDYLELHPGTVSEPHVSACREVVIVLEGEPAVLWRDHEVPMKRLDVFSIEPSANRRYTNQGNQKALLMRVRDLENDK